jgi:iron only hydrogenase large subunit-like protein
MPNQILLALKEIGFDHVYDEAWMCEMANAAIEKYIEENPEPKPKISTVCPAVVRLVAFLYPELIPNIIPIESPRELAGKLLRSRLIKSMELSNEDIGILHVTPCNAKMISINRPIGLSKSALDGAISVGEIYGQLLESVQNVHEDVILQQSSGIGLGWAVAGGEIRGIQKENCLAVSGVWDVIHILDDVEAGRLNDIEYLECLACPDGCVGGPLNVENRHKAKKRTESLVKMFGEKSRVSEKMISELYTSGFFSLEKTISAHPFPPLDKDPSRAIQKRQMMEDVIPQLGGRECGACGAPDCKTLARDIVMKEATLEDCVFYKKHRQERDTR